MLPGSFRDFPGAAQGSLYHTTLCFFSWWLGENSEGELTLFHAYLDEHSRHRE